MSELPEDVPSLSAEASEFLKRHAATGEPSAEGLARARRGLPTSGARLLRVARAVAPFAATAALVALGFWGWSVMKRPKAEPVVEAPKPSVSEPAIPIMTLVDEAKPPPAPLPDPKTDELREVYLRAYMLRDSDPVQSRQLLERIVTEGDPRSETVQKAKGRLRDLGERGRVDVNDFVEDLDEVFMRAYVIRDAQPEEAAKLFRRIVEAKDADPELRRKAKTQLDAMDDGL